ncbi:YheC/YheD family protein [Bacillus sp. RG28]|uniref:YheC/YheD family protein n=1 Tax=Gottfriedia endophytica TaxID=2820819 RepID=A0A940NS99_9BACI|nr:YheC/YheD family protein [Gottfriedia endophytica]MBP0726900.1 YheC/YheD family protein [Gottfriedia endophytica]
MTSVFYHLTSSCWYHNDSNDICKLGKNKLSINKIVNHTSSKDYLTFPVKKNDTHLGPIVAILTGKEREPFSGNYETFKRISNYIMNSGGIPIIVTPSSFVYKCVNAHYYCSNRKKWIQIQCPFPDLVYNRIPSPLLEKLPEYKKTIQLIKDFNIPFFNKGFCSKKEFVELLSKNRNLSKYLPPSVTIHSKEELLYYLVTWKSIYVKHHEASQGKGIFCFNLLTENQIEIQSSKGHSQICSLEKAWNFLRPFLHSTVIQKNIHSILSNGQKYDLRVLVHKQKEKYIVSGIGVRVANLNAITTHVPRGGSIMSVTKLSTPVNQFIINNLANEIGKALTNRFGPYYEFSMDIGRDKENHYYIFEVNSKPMVFDEEEIKKRGLENLVSLFYELTKFEP